MSVTSPDSSSPTAFEDQSATVCYLCRQRKTKCDRNLPSCSHCVKAKVECQYVPQPKKRGLRAGYVSELEARLEAVEHELKRVKRDSVTPRNPLQSKPHDMLLSPQESLFTNTEKILSSKSSGPSCQHQTNHSGVAVELLKEVPLPLLESLVDLWFKECQPWYPILQRAKLQHSLENLSIPVERIDNIVLRALIAHSISHSSQAIAFGYKGRRELAMYLRSEVLVEAMARVSLDSLQALLIIAILDYGNDDIPSTWSLLSVCRRICEQLGLFRRLLSQMQHQTPGQVSPPSLEAFEGDELALPLAWVTLALDSASTLGAGWRDASAALTEHLSSIANASAPNLRDSYKAHVHLCAIGLQPVHTYLYNHRDFEFFDSAIADEIWHNLISYCPLGTATGYSFLPDGSIDFDVNSIFTSILLNAAIINLYGRYLDLTSPPQADPNQIIALERCARSFMNVVRTIRTVSDIDTEFSSPLLATKIYDTARYQLALCKITSQTRPAEFDVLMHALNMCGRRWSVARRLDIVLRAAIVELDKWHLVTSPVPAVFWDLRKSGLDVDDTLKDWVQNYKPCLFVGSLNGPYA